MGASLSELERDVKSYRSGTLTGYDRDKVPRDVDDYISSHRTRAEGFGLGAILVAIAAVFPATSYIKDYNELTDEEQVAEDSRMKTMYVITAMLALLALAFVGLSVYNWTESRQAKKLREQI
jgi:hypothetical protein